MNVEYAASCLYKLFAVLSSPVHVNHRWHARHASLSPNPCILLDHVWYTESGESRVATVTLEMVDDRVKSDGYTMLTVRPALRRTYETCDLGPKSTEAFLELEKVITLHAARLGVLYLEAGR